MLTAPAPTPRPRRRTRCAVPEPGPTAPSVRVLLPAQAPLQLGREDARLWRVTHGLLRIDRQLPDGQWALCGVRLPGDPVCAEGWADAASAGCLNAQPNDACPDSDPERAEALADGLARSPVRVRALVPSTVTVWSGEGQAAPDALSVLRAVLRMQARQTVLLALRDGATERRVARLLALLAPDEDGQIVLPRLQDIGELAGIAMETVSRALSRLRQDGVWQPGARRHHVRIDRAALSAVASSGSAGLP